MKDNNWTPYSWVSNLIAWHPGKHIRHPQSAYTFFFLSFQQLVAHTLEQSNITLLQCEAAV